MIQSQSFQRFVANDHLCEPVHLVNCVVD